MAHVGVAHARSAAVLRRHVFPARQPLRAARVRRDSRADRRRLADQPRRRSRNRRARSLDQLQKQAAVEPGRAEAIDPGLLDSGFFVFRRTFDPQLGGFGGAPKFPRPAVFNFLLRYHARTKSQEALDMVLLTLREMAKGGMHDQLGGGFHRYSVDERWFVPHFEKMLYDQAQLAISYLEAFQITHDPQYAGVARAHLRLRAARHDGCRRRLLFGRGRRQRDRSREPDDQRRRRVLHLDRRGDPRAGARARSRLVLPSLRRGRRAATWRRSARGVHRPEHPVPGCDASRRPRASSTARWTRFARGSIAPARILLEARAKRVRPHLDDKVLTAWNGLMISAFAIGGAVLDEPRYAEAARRAAGFLLTRMYEPRAGTLLRRYREGDAAIPGFLDDYALFVQALLDLYEAQFDRRHLELAIRLTEKQRELFEDRRAGRILQLRRRATRPGAAGEGRLRRRRAFRELRRDPESAAAGALHRRAPTSASPPSARSAAFGPRLSAAPVALPQMLVGAASFALGRSAGDRARGRPRRRRYRRTASVRCIRRFLPQPNRAAGGFAGDPLALAAGMPAVDGMEPVAGRAAAYVCQQLRLPAARLRGSEAGRVATISLNHSIPNHHFDRRNTWKDLEQRR